MEGSRFGVCVKTQLIWSVACLAEKYAQQAAPANNPALSNSNDCAKSKSTKAWGETSRWVVSGSRLLLRFVVRLAM
jgi:hypothetical protein